MRNNFSKVRLETNRLVLRFWTESDLNEYHDYAKTPGVGEAAGWEHHPNIEYSRIKLKELIKDKNSLAIVHKEDNKVIGSISMRKTGYVSELVSFYDFGLDIGYSIAKEYWSQGLTPEAMAVVIDYCFEELQLDFLIARATIHNFRSRRVLEKSNFIFEKKTTHIGLDGRPEELVCMVLTSDRWAKFNT